MAGIKPKERMSAVVDLRGLDMVTPVDLLSDGRTPDSKNFRLYAQQTDDRRVAVSSRKGPGFHTLPIGETLSDSVGGSVGASTVDVGIMTGVHAIPFTAISNDRITRIDLKVSDNAQASGPLMVQIYTDKDNMPSALLTESSILGGDIGPDEAWATARFVNAIKMQSGAKYWIVVRMQDDGVNTYQLSTTTAGTKAWKTNSTLSQIVEQDYAVNYRLYTAIDGLDKGAYRFARDNGVNITLAAFGTAMYRVDESTSSFVKIIDGLSPLAKEYSFTNGDNKVFWVNGYDKLTSWDGTLETEAGNMQTNGTFETNTSGWFATGGGSGTALTRVTTDKNSGVASMNVTATSGVRVARTTVTLKKNHRYKFTYYIKGTGGSVYMYAYGPNVAIPGSDTALNGSWQKVELYYTPSVNTITDIGINSNTVNFLLDDVTFVDTGIEYYVDEQLPVMSDIIMHKDRLWGVDAADPNKLVFSENPGNPSNKPIDEQWYRQWLSVSFIYVPRPHNGSPITGLVSFQDSLVVFTQDEKYIISGYDRGSFNLRKSTGSKGAISNKGIAIDENRIYFVSDDGFYEFNGSSDEKLSTRISPLFDGCGHKENISAISWKNQVRFYMASHGSKYNDICAIFDKDIKEWMLDTDTWVSRALYYNDADDEQQLIEFSSLVPVSYMAEQNYHSLGAPIDFEYRLKYDSMGTPAQRKRLRRFYPILQGVDNSFTIQLAMDKDFEDSPRIKEQLLTTNGAKWGEFKWGDGTIYGGDKSFKLKRQSYSGYAYYWQLRVIRKGVNNRVAFVGAQYSYKTKRL